jgi:hypothetical protein
MPSLTRAIDKPQLLHSAVSLPSPQMVFHVLSRGRKIYISGIRRKSFFSAFSIKTGGVVRRGTLDV